MTVNTAINSELKKCFKEKFNTKPQLYKAPGRINLIGEHTDYNNGFVLPAAIDKAIYYAVAPNNLNKLRLYSLDYDEYFETALDTLEKSKVHWANYLIGVTVQFQKKGYKPGGMDCVFGGDIPLGAGLSSSAALECGFAICINDLFSFGIDNSELILMAQKAEHEFAGVLCGIMDQFASTYGKSGHVMKLDCRSLDYEYYPFTNHEVEIILCDTKIKHTLASSEYNVRHSECEKGVAILQERFPYVKSLRDATPALLKETKTRMENNVFLRCHYVIHEIIRVEQACQALVQNNFTQLGKLMYETHEGLSNEYRVSCRELDILVDIARKHPDVLGARMMGGGFGGCTINLIRKEGTEKFIRSVKEVYPRVAGSETEIYHVKISEGAGKLAPQYSNCNEPF
jgi:galactokinase